MGQLVVPDGLNVTEATERSICEARRIGLLSPVDDAAVEALRALARRIDALIEQHGTWLDISGKLDNVSVPTFLKYCDSLGLTPAGRVRLAEKKEDRGDSNTLTKLRSVHTDGRKGRRGA